MERLDPQRYSNGLVKSRGKREWQLSKLRRAALDNVMADNPR